MKANKKQKIIQLVSTAGKMNNICIYDVEFNPSLVRVYIESVEKHVDLHLCEKFMKALLFLFHSEKIEDMECEISSPGLERQLKKDWHFLTAVGKIVKIHTNQPVFCYDKKREKKRQATTLKGQLYKCKDNIINVNDGLLDWTVPLEVITKANIIFEDKKQRKRSVV